MNCTEASQGKTWKLPLYLKALRAPFLAATTLPMVLGGLLALKGKGGTGTLLVLTIACGALINLATNTLNDYFDYIKGSDNSETPRTPFSGGSGLIVDGDLSAVEVARLSAVLILLVIATGLFVLILSPADPFIILLLGLGGVFLGYAYSAPPLRLSARGLGELTVFIACGPLSVMAPYYIMSGTFSTSSFFVSLSPGLMTTAILWINQFPDLETDEGSGKINLLVRVGKRMGRFAYYMLILMALFFLLLAALDNFLPMTSLWGLLFLVPLLPAGGILYKHYDDPVRLVPAMALTIASQVILSLSMIVSLVLQESVPIFID